MTMKMAWARRRLRFRSSNIQTVLPSAFCLLLSAFCLLPSAFCQQTTIPTPTLPQALVDVSTLPKVSGTTRTATSCSNIQTQLNAAVGGDEVVIPASFNCTGASAVNLTLPNHGGNGYVWVHTDQVGSLPSLGARVTLQHAVLMPILTGATGSPNSDILAFPSSAVATTLNGAITATAPANGGALTVASTTGFASTGTVVVTPGGTSSAELMTYTGITATTFTGITRCAGGNFCGGIVRPGKAHASLDAVHGSSAAQNPSAYWWITGLSLNTPAIGFGGALVQVGDVPGTPTHTTVADMPTHIVIDRCLLLGNPGFEVDNGLVIQGTYVAMIGSYLDDVHISGGEGHGWLTTDGAGPFLIENNEIHALAISTFFGGSDPYVPGLVPSDIIIRRNWIQNRPGWYPGIPIPSPAPVLTGNATGGTIACGASVSVQETLTNSIQGIVGETTGGTISTVTIPTSGCSASGSVTVATTASFGDALTGKATGINIYDCTGASCTPKLHLQNQPFLSNVTLTTVGSGATVPTTNTTNPLYLNGNWLFKNEGEFKNSKRVLIENNVVENTWAGAQCGALWQFNTASDGSTTNENGHATIRYNAAIGQNSLGDGIGGTTGPNNGQVATHDVSITNSVAYNSTGYCTYRTIVGNNAGTKNLNFQHNTDVPFRTSDWSLVQNSLMFYGASATGAGVVPVGPTAIHNNIMDVGKGGVGQSCTEGGASTDCYSNGGAYLGTESFYGDVMYNNADSPATCSTRWQTDNSWDYEKHSCSSANAAPWNAAVANLAGVGFVDTTSGVFDLRLLQSSSFIASGTDGLDPGADFIGLTRHIAGVSNSLPSKWSKIAVAQASNVGQTSAILKWVNFSLNGTLDTCEYGTTTAYGTSCTVTQVGDQNFSAITGLTASTKYFWRVGGTTGMWGSFTTTGAPPSGRTLALGATINAASTGTYSLDYGPTTSYGTTVTQSCTINTTCSVLAANVAAGTYHFCLRSPGVTSCPTGGDQVTVLQ